jgi:hypothetical protein
MTEPRSGSPVLTIGQGGKENTINAAISRMAALTVGSAVAIQSAPPGGPPDGSVYIVGAAPTGAWSGQVNKIAHFRTATSWVFIAPQVGYSLSLIAMGGKRVYWDGSSWSIVGGNTPKASAIATTTTALSLSAQNLPMVVDQVDEGSSWDPVLDQFEIVGAGLLQVAYKILLEGTSSGVLGTATLFLQKNGLDAYHLADVEVGATTTKQVISGALQIDVANNDTISLRIDNYVATATMNLVGGGKSWIQVLTIR